jgi:hypothetical protein
MRTVIRAYCWDLVKSAVADMVSDRVYLGRVSPTTIKELPCIIIGSLDELIEPMGGTQHVPDGLERTITVPFYTIARVPQSANDSAELEDFLDLIGHKIEIEFTEDRFFQKRFPAYGLDMDYGILAGNRLTAISADRKAETEFGLAVQVMTYELLYEDEGINEKQTNMFNSYLLELRRVGWTESTVDPVLIAAEGDLT